MGRETRYDTDDLHQQAVPVIVERDMHRGVAERIMADGSIRQALDETMLVERVRDLVEHNGAEAIAISFMNSYRQPMHEKRAGEVVAEMYPDLPISISSSVAPEIREYVRTNTACVNAYVQPRVRGYLQKLSKGLAEHGFRGYLSIMLSSGGLTSIEEAMQFPVRLIESGPAAGAIAASHIARKIGADKVLSFDMGGTTATVCVIEDATPNVKFEFEAGRLERFKAGSKLPLKVAVVDMIEISGGGGSIASKDALGLMKVGPRSANSEPGPVAYGRGGTAPTVTDADLSLGYLNPDYFLGGEMALRLADVHQAIDETLATPLRMGVEDAAKGIRSIIDESMAAATRMHMAKKGKDPRDFTMVAFGGASPVHAYNLARLLGVQRIVVPMGAGVISAFGFLVAAPSVNDARGYFAPVEEIDWSYVGSLMDEMKQGARPLLAAEDASEQKIAIRYAADMRYKGQGFEVTVPLPADILERSVDDAERARSLKRAFQDRYRDLFDRAVENVPVEMVNWRLSASLPVQDVNLAYSNSSTAAERPTRVVTFGDHGPLNTSVFDRYALARGQKLNGPAVFEERESSFIMGPEGTALVDEFHNLVVDIQYP